MKSHPKKPAKSPADEFTRFTDFMRRLVAVPRSEIKARLDAEKRKKEKK